MDTLLDFLRGSCKTSPFFALPHFPAGTITEMRRSRAFGWGEARRHQLFVLFPSIWTRDRRDNMAGHLSAPWAIRSLSRTTCPEPAAYTESASPRRATTRRRTSWKCPSPFLPPSHFVKHTQTYAPLEGCDFVVTSRSTPLLC